MVTHLNATIVIRDIAIVLGNVQSATLCVASTLPASIITCAGMFEVPMDE